MSFDTHNKESTIGHSKHDIAQGEVLSMSVMVCCEGCLGYVGHRNTKIEIV